MKTKNIAILLGCVCVVFVIAICIQIKTIDFANNSVSSSYAEDKLRDEVLRWKQNYDSKNNELKKLEKLLETIRTKASENNEDSAKMTEELNRVNRLLGLTELKGKGLVIKLDDNKVQAAEAQDRL